VTPPSLQTQKLPSKPQPESESHTAFSTLQFLCIYVAGARYVKLNRQAMGCVRAGGLLLTFSCSASVVNHKQLQGRDRDGTSSMHEQFFASLIQEAARLAGRNVTVIRELDGGNDHPIHIANPESKYLTGMLLRIG
jgi:23S rRNA (cytosine1962-C5)-methyltransferase